MSEARAEILARLRHARAGLPPAPSRPARYQSVTPAPENTPSALLARFTAELERLDGEVFLVADEAAALQRLLATLAHRDLRSVLTWDWRHIPLPGLKQALAGAGIEALQPAPDNRVACEAAAAGITGADAAIAATGSLVVSTAPGMGRLPTLLPPLHIALLRQEQILPDLEAWVAHQRAGDLAQLQARSNFCLISGPSRTADIEKDLVLGMHGPGALQVIVLAAQG